MNTVASLRDYVSRMISEQSRSGMKVLILDRETVCVFWEGSWSSGEPTSSRRHGLGRATLTRPIAGSRAL
jgi:hypothetical protein